MHEQAELVLVAVAWRKWAVPFAPQIALHLGAPERDVIFVGPKMLAYDALKWAEKHHTLPVKERDGLFSFHRETQRIDRELSILDMQGQHLSLVDMLCVAPGDCATFTENGASVYSDKMHFSKEGARWVGTRLLERRLLPLQER